MYIMRRSRRDERSMNKRNVDFIHEWCQKSLFKSTKHWQSSFVLCRHRHQEKKQIVIWMNMNNHQCRLLQSSEPDYRNHSFIKKSERKMCEMFLCKIKTSTFIGLSFKCNYNLMTNCNFVVTVSLITIAWQ
jgi:hypothetical protein